MTASAILIAYTAVSGPLDRRAITSAMAFVAIGFVVGASSLGLLNVSLESTVAERVTELALVFLLFSDSARLDLGSLRREVGWPSRLLLIGLPLTMVLGLGAGLLLFPGMAVTSAFLLSTMLCSTDAALGQRVVEDTAVPSRVRQVLDVESGLNDGLAVPFFLVALDISAATLVGGVSSAVISEAASQIGWGLVSGVGAGAIGGLVFRISDRHNSLQAQWRQVFTFAVALGAYAMAVTLGGSGFIAAFVAGLTFGSVSGEHGLRVTYFTAEAGNVLAAATWMGFGALAISSVLPDVTWRVVVYALLSLTVVRILPVAVAMAGTGARWQTVAFMGWFGPRGLASVVFGLLALERGIPEAPTLLATVVVTVGLSVFLHGLTSVPFVARYHRWYTAKTVAHPSAAEAKPTQVPRGRRRFGSDPAFAAEDSTRPHNPEHNGSSTS
jgi:NhaP-type Na+/H+ or K+/H+ antiporter